MNGRTRILVGVRRFFSATLDLYVYVMLALVFVVAAYPFWYILIYSISDPATLHHGFLIFPAGFSFRAYSVTFANPSVLQAFAVSVARSVLGPVSSVTVSMLVAYGLSRKGLPGARSLSVYFILTMYFGAGLIPAYILIKNLGLTNSFWIYILPGLTNVFGMILMRAYIQTLPDSLSESAYIDGANDFAVFARIVTPLCIPVIAAITLFSCVGHWNSYTDTLIYNSGRPKLWTLQYVLVTLVSTISASQSPEMLNDMATTGRGGNLTPMAVRMAMTIITIVPISLVYPVLQKYFAKGILIGAVKG